MLDIIDDIRDIILKKKLIIISFFIIIVFGLLFGSIYITILKASDKKDLMTNVSNYFDLYKNIDFSSKIDIFKVSLIKNII